MYSFFRRLTLIFAVLLCQLMAKAQLSSKTEIKGDNNEVINIQNHAGDSSIHAETKVDGSRNKVRNSQNIESEEPESLIWKFLSRTNLLISIGVGILGILGILGFSINKRR